MIVAVVGSRERRQHPDDRSKVEEVIGRLMFEHGNRLVVVSVGCDFGINKTVFDICSRLNIKLVEFRSKFFGPDFLPEEINKMFSARNASVVAISDEFYLFTGPNPEGLVEQIEKPARAKVNDSRVFMYEESK